MSDITAAMPEVVQALRSVGIDNPEVFTRPVYERCEECGGADQWLVPVTGGPGDRGRRHHSRACSKRADDDDLRAPALALANGWVAESSRYDQYADRASTQEAAANQRQIARTLRENADALRALAAPTTTDEGDDR